MRYLAQTWVPFFCGSVVVMNLSRLVETNPNYEAAWWKVAMALMLAVVVPLLWRENKTPNVI